MRSKERGKCGSARARAPLPPFSFTPLMLFFSGERSARAARSGAPPIAIFRFERYFDFTFHFIAAIAATPIDAATIFFFIIFHFAIFLALRCLPDAAIN
jgi:hypothetical protein